MKRRMQGSNGPLMTDHLRDLDLELQLLKRKRSMIEQQQRMLSDSRQQPYQQDFDMGYQRNFANLYEDDHHRGLPAGSQFGQNYHSDAIWDHPTPQPQPTYSAPQPAHYEFSDNRNNDLFANKKKPRRPNPWANPTPLLNTPISAPNFSQSGSKQAAKISRLRSKYSSEVPPKRRSDFKPVKVTKTKTTSSHVDTLKKQNLPGRKDLIKRAAPVVIPRKSSVNEKYLPDVTPSNQVVGRMEFCLGTVLKDIRSVYGSSHAHVINDPNHIRTIKEVIRERVQELMIGKVVSGNTVVIDQYRAKYPISTDKEIVDLCINADLIQKHKQHFKLFLPEDDPEKFFKINFHKLFVKKLDDMFAKIALLHKQQNEKTIDSIVKDLPDLTVDGKGLTAAIMEQETDSLNTNAENTNGASDNIADVNEETKSEAVKSEPPISEVEVTETPNNELNESSEKSDKVEKMTTQETTEAVTNAENGNEDKKQIDKMDNAQKTKFYLDLLDKLIEQRLPLWVERKRNEILEIMDIDQEFKLTRAAVILETNKKAEKLAKVPLIHFEKSPNQKAEAKKSASKEQADKAEGKPINSKKLLYVKILAKPNLPETSVMKTFLDRFNPKLIKKPRTVPNLLIIGLSHETDYENLLAANGTTIGKMKLLVTKSERLNSKKNDEKPQEETTVKAEGDKDDKIIPDDLENQITDLLSSIRKAEESESIEDSTNVNTEQNDTTKIPEMPNDKTITIEPQTDAGDANVANTIVEAQQAKPMETTETKLVETVTKVATDENGDKKAQVSKTVEDIQKQDNPVLSTPTRSSGRITRSKLAILPID